MNTLSTEPEKIDRETLSALYDETFKNIEEGTITEGRVIDIQRDRFFSLSVGKLDRSTGIHGLNTPAGLLQAFRFLSSL